MAILKFLGASIYGIVASYLIWLLFYFITPWVMSFGWGGVIISVIAGSLFAGIFFVDMYVDSVPNDGSDRSHSK